MAKVTIDNTFTPLVHNPENVLEVNQLKKVLPRSRKVCCSAPWAMSSAVDGISFNIKRGTTMGLVGESGCGKTTVGRTILRLTDKSGGEVLFNGTRGALSSAATSCAPCARRCRSSSRIPTPACHPACPSAKSWAKRFVSTASCPTDEFERLHRQAS